jgi:hypothetical protein
MYIEGFFKVATSHAGKFTIVAQELEHNTYSSHVSNTRLNHKAAAIRYTSGFLGDPKPWMKTQNKRRTSILDVGEFSVFTPIVNEC